MAFFHKASKTVRHFAETWLALGRVRLTLDLDAMALNNVAFGTPPARAMAFGRPGRVTGDETGRGNFTLDYANSGFVLEYEDGRLGYMGFLFGSEGADPDAGPPGPCALTLEGSPFGSRSLKPETTPARVADLLGPPRSTDEDESETVLYYERDGHTLEFEFSPAGALRRFNVFPSPPPS